MSFIGIDLGTSFIKGAVLNLDAQRLEHIRRIPFPSRLKLANPLLCEFDPNEVATAARMILDDLVPYTSQCEGVVMCSQMHGMVLMNEHGEALSNCISWMDHRGTMPHPSGSGSYFDALIRRTYPEQRAQLGNELCLERPASFLFWLSEQGMLEPGLIPVSMPDFVVSALCGSVTAVEMTNASASGLFNVESLDWHHGVIEDLGLGSLRFPEIRNIGEAVGYSKFGARQVPWYTPIGDFQCALLSLNISTGAQVSRLTTVLKPGNYQTRPSFEGSFLNTFSDIPGGRSLNVLVNILGELAAAQTISDDSKDPWIFIAQAARGVLDTDLKIDLSSSDKPEGAQGMISNIREDNFTVGHLFRASFKEMAEVYHTNACRLWPERAWKNIVFSGGVASKLGVLRETIQKRFDTEYRLCPFVEDTLYGLLILASVFSGRAKSIKEVTERLRSGLAEDASAK
jgi:sugar (pentulose or hexulose) kinase